MEFLDTYKRLDNLCKDLFQSEKGVSSYITEMENCHSYNYQIQGWDTDYQNLKRYRYIRNQIVHENWASEDSLCEINDVRWLNDFHQRILNQTDPLAQYRKLVQRIRQQNSKILAKTQASDELSIHGQIPSDKPTNHHNNYKGYLIGFIAILAIITLLIAGVYTYFKI